MAQLREKLAGEAGDRAVVIYADLVGEVVDIPPYSDKRAAVCGYFDMADVWRADCGVVVVAGAETAL